MKRQTVKVYFSDGDSLISTINGTKKEVREYYKVGKVFNLGDGDRDRLVKVKKVEFI